MKEKEISDDLIQSCIRQDRRAQNMFYNLTYARLINICRRYGRNDEDARELFAQGFLKILNNLEKYHSPMPFESWISRVMINAIIDEHRKQLKFKEHHRFVEDNLLEYLQGAEFNHYEKKVSNNEALNMLRNLPPATREVFALFAIDDYTHKEIAEKLGISENTSKWHVSDARKRLIEELKKNFKIEKVYERQTEKSIG